MKLRPYQQEAFEHAIKIVDSGSNPTLQLATGTGKSLIIAALADHFNCQNKNVWILTHVQKLVDQNAKTFVKFSGYNCGILCASLGRKEYDQSVTFATIQSIKRPANDGLIQSPDVIIIDEAHRVPHVGSAGNYEAIFNLYPGAIRIAMTATPWRTDNGIIYGKGKDFWFDTLAYKYSVPDAVKDGWLSPLVGVETELQLNVDSVSVTDDFVQSEVEHLQTVQWLRAVAHSLLILAGNRKHISVYCPTVKSASLAAVLITEVTGWEGVVLSTANTQSHNTKAFKDFETGTARFMCSVDMATTGYDFPALDCLVVLRPTLASNLWVQMQGRGTRLHPDKKNCLVLDFVGNLMRLGGVDMYETFYREKGLTQVEAVAYKPYEKRERKLLPGVKTLIPIDPTTGESVRDNSELKVQVHSINQVPMITRRNRNRQVLMVTYACTTEENARIDATLFLDCDTSNLTEQVIRFVRDRKLAVSLPIPARNLNWQVKNARKPTHIKVRKSGKYWNVLEEYFD